MSVNKSINKNLTIPNLLSVIRIVIVPFFAYYFIKGQTYPAIALLILSGISDCLDGFIARKFNQITEIGKILDPFADKITQVTVALCLAIRFPAICPFLILFLVKELSMLVCGIYLIGHKKRKPGASLWFGKVATVMFYISAGVIFLMEIIAVPVHTFNVVSNCLLFLTALMMTYSAVGYLKVYLTKLDSNDEADAINLKEEMKAKKEVNPQGTSANN